MRWWVGLDVFGEQLGLLGFELIAEIMRAYEASGDFLNLTFFLRGIDLATKRNEAVQGNDLDIFGVQRHVVCGDYIFANLRGDRCVILTASLVERG